MSYFDKLKQKYLNTDKKPKPTRIEPEHECNHDEEELPPPSTTPSDLVSLPSTILPTDDTDTQPYKSVVGTPRFGTHVSVKNGFKEALEYAKSKGYNCAQLFASSPRSSKITKQIDPKDAEQCKKYIEEHDMELWIHCAYTINFCRPCNNDTKYLRDAVVQDMKKAIALGALGCTIHVGKTNCSAGVIESKDALPNFKQNIESTITELLKDKPETLPWLLIETAAGQGTETPVTVQGLANLYNLIEPTYRKYIGFCVDTCHVFASGECDMRDPDKIDAFIALWNSKIGWEHVKLIHYNDSECEFKSRKDRHAPIGEGCAGKTGLDHFKRLCILTGKSMVTEY